MTRLKEFKVEVNPTKAAVPKEVAPSVKATPVVPVATFPDPESTTAISVTVTGPALVLVNTKFKSGTVVTEPDSQEAFGGCVPSTMLIVAAPGKGVFVIVAVEVIVGVVVMVGVCVEVKVFVAVVVKLFVTVLV